MTVSPGFRFKPSNTAPFAGAAALFAAVLALGALAPATAQAGGYNAGGYSDDGEYDIGNDPNQNYDNGGYQNSGSSDDGSYASDQRGYSQDDDEDGYEDGQDAPDVAYFYDELEDEGTWENDPEYGQVWSPRNVDADWRPYTRGTWANTEEHGWYWVSDEPFGWATYHYGRWHLSERRGWVWVPGTRWGPAWVAWRSNDENIGWAPLPPEARWDHGQGLRVDATIYESPRFSAYWSFVEPRYITTPRIYTYCAPRTRVTTIITTTRPQTNYVFINRRIVNRGVSVTTIERVTRTRVTTVRVNQSDNRSYRTVRRETNVINVYRPKLTRTVVRDRPAGRPVVDRAQFRDVDKRPVRRYLRDQPKDGRRDIRRDNPQQRAVKPSPIDDLARQQAAPSKQVNPNDNARAFSGAPQVKSNSRNLNREFDRNPDRNRNAEPNRNADKARERNRANNAVRQQNNPYVQKPNQGGQPQFSADTFKPPSQGNPQADNPKKQKKKKKNED